MSVPSPPFQDVLEVGKTIEEKQIIGIIVVIGALFIFLALTKCVQKIYEGSSSGTQENRKIYYCKFPLGVLPDYQTVVRLEEEELPTYLQAISWNEKKTFL
eukprot:GFUD01052576.1.p1 GENE.GFUD01052576.1~~GFUD01052576.1.p1  ORF type:complete len:101 (+),score=11.60 GFUD01052576.1:91-393(+)